MPITAQEKEQLVNILAKAKSGELVKITALIYDTIMHAKINTESLTSLGKMIQARVPWNDVPELWVRFGGRVEDLLLRRVPLVRATEEFFLKNIAEAFTIVEEAPSPPEPEPEPPQPSEDEIAQEVAHEAELAEEALHDMPPPPSAPKQNGKKVPKQKTIFDLGAMEESLPPPPPPEPEPEPKTETIASETKTAPSETTTTPNGEGEVHTPGDEEKAAAPSNEGSGI